MNEKNSSFEDLNKELVKPVWRDIALLPGDWATQHSRARQDSQDSQLQQKDVGSNALSAFYCCFIEQELLFYILFQLLVSILQYGPYHSNKTNPFITERILIFKHSRTMKFGVNTHPVVLFISSISGWGGGAGERGRLLRIHT